MAASINRELGVLKRAFKLTLQDSILGIVPHVPMLPETTVRKGFVTHPQFLAIAAKLPSIELKDVAEFLYLTGWRLGEGLTLECRDEGAVLHDTLAAARMLTSSCLRSLPGCPR